MAKGLTASKAKKILEDGTVRGKALTEKQKKFFGAVAGGATPLKKLNGGWLDKFAMGGSLPGASGMMYARTSGTSPEEPKKAQEGTIQLDEVVVTAPGRKKDTAFRDSDKDGNVVSRFLNVGRGKKREELFKDMPEYLQINDNGDYVLSLDQQQELENLGITDLDSYNDYFGTNYSRDNALNEFNYLNYYKPQYDDMISSIHGATNQAAKNIMTAASFIPIVRGASMASKAPQAYRYLANSPVGRAASKYIGKPFSKSLNYKPFGGPVSIGNAIDASSAAYAAYATPEAYRQYQENPNFDTGSDLALTAVDLVPFSEIFTGGKNIRKLYNKGKNLLTNDLKPNPNMYYRGIGQSGLDDITESGLLRAKPADKIPFNGMGTKFDFAKRFNNLYVTPRLSVADRYGRGVVAEIPKDVANFSKRYKNSDWSMMTDNQIPIEEVNLYKKNFFGNYKPVNIPQPPLSSMPFSKPNIYPTSSPLPKSMEPYLSRRVYPFNKEQEIFESFLPIEAQLKNIDLKSIRYDADGNIIPNMEYGGEIDKAQWGKLLKLAKKYGSKAVDYLKGLRSEGQMVTNAANTTGNVKYLDELSYEAKKDIRDLNYKVQSKTDKETRKLGKPHVAQEEYGEGWKYSDEVDFNNPEEVAAHRKRWIDSQKKGNFLYQNRSFPLFDETSDIFTDLTRYDLNSFVGNSIDRPFATRLGNRYTSALGEGTSYTIGGTLNPRPQDFLTQDVSIRSGEFDKAWKYDEPLKEKMDGEISRFFNSLYEPKTSKIDFGDLLKNKNRSGGDIPKAQVGLLNKLYKMYKGVKGSSNVVEPMLKSGITARRLSGDQLYNTHRYSAKQLDQLLKESREFLKNTPSEGYENSTKFKAEALRRIENLEQGVKKDLALQEIAKRSRRTVGDDTGTWMAKSYVDAPSSDQLGHVTTSNNLWDMVFKSDGKMIPYSKSETLYFNRGGEGQLARIRMMAPENQGGGINLIFDNNSLKKSGIFPDSSGGEFTISQDVSLKHLYPEAKIKAKDMLLNEAEFRGVEITDDLLNSIDDALQIKKNKNGSNVSKAKDGGRCWPGYKTVPGKTPFSKGSCQKAQDGYMVPSRKGVRLNYDEQGNVIGESTHIMKAEQLEDGTWVGFPSLFQNEDGKWVDMSGEKDWMNIYNEALKRGEVIEFGKDKEAAIKFGEGSWKSPKMKDGGWLDKFQEGGVIEDDRGQWAYPGEVTKINSNNITMKGVNYPVLGISDTGDTKMMQPGVENYTYDGSSVTEFPMAKDGKSLVELNQLTNFTNYNTPQPGGWLDKY